MFFVHGEPFTSAETRSRLKIFRVGTPIDGRRPHAYSVVDLETYLSLFAHKETAAVRGESSTTYLANANIASANIKRLVDKPFIIASVRDPVDRAYSAYAFAVSLGIEKRSFRDALLADARGERGWPQATFYHTLSCISRGLVTFQEVFGKDRCLFFPYTMLSTECQGLLERITDFLGVERFRFDVAEKYNVRQRRRGGELEIRAEDRKLCDALFEDERAALKTLVNDF